MIDDQNFKMGKPLNPFTATHRPGADGTPRSKSGEGEFAGSFERLKTSVIRPVFETVGNGLKERGHEINISEEPGGKISIHIVPAGANKSIHRYDWFPTLSFFGAPYQGTVGLHGRNMRPNSEVSSGSRGDYTLARVSKEIVEKELMKFIGEIGNW